jgi:chaperone modulatory protein CbpM
MITLVALRAELHVDAWELEEWIARRWVRPVEDEAGVRFEEIDVARVRLIQVLRHEMELDDGAVPVVLSLLDQLHAARRELLALRGRGAIGLTS